MVELPLDNQLLQLVMKKDSLPKSDDITITRLRAVIDKF